MTAAVAHHYRHFRGNMDRPASEALASARSHVNFLARLSFDVKAANKRSRAAKRGWSTRRAKVGA